MSTKKSTVRYCEACSQRIPEKDFVAGVAVVWKDQTYCANHVPAAFRSQMAKRSPSAHRVAPRANPTAKDTQPPSAPIAATPHAGIALALFGVGALSVVGLVVLVVVSTVGTPTATTTEPLANTSNLANRHATTVSANPTTTGQATPPVPTPLQGNSASNSNSLGIIADTKPAERPEPPTQDHLLGVFRVANVIDGHTLKINGLERTVRLVGVECEDIFRGRGGKSAQAIQHEAERNFADYAAKVRGSYPKPVSFGTPLGMATRDWVAHELQDAHCQLEFDDLQRKRDIFERPLVHVFYRVGAGGTWKHLNLELVRRGYSPYYVKYGRCVRFHAEFEAAQAEARTAGRLIWTPAAGRVPEHYLDYDERIAWWRRCDAALSLYETRRTANPATVPLSLEDGRDEAPLQARIDQNVTVFGRAYEVDLSNREVKLSFKANRPLIVRFANLDQMRKLWPPDFFGELLELSGRLSAERDRWVLHPDQIAPYR